MHHSRRKVSERHKNLFRLRFKCPCHSVSGICFSQEDRRLIAYVVQKRTEKPDTIIDKVSAHQSGVLTSELSFDHLKRCTIVPVDYLNEVEFKFICRAPFERRFYDLGQVLTLNQFCGATSGACLFCSEVDITPQQK